MAIFETLTLVRTCRSHPAQWEGRTTDRRPFYVRYRSGWLTVTVGEPDGGMASGEPFAEVQVVGPDVDGGSMDDDEMVARVLEICGVNVTVSDKAVKR